MSETPNLALPLIAAGQAQKHVTHNEALFAVDVLLHLAVLDKDLASPPATPAPSARYIVAASPTGAWAGHAQALAAWQDGAWLFLTPRAGMLAFVVDEALLYVSDGTGWTSLTSALASIQSLGMLGIGTVADATNPFSAKLNGALWTARTAGEGGTGDLRYTFNKESASHTGSLLFQTGYSGRAEIGLSGDDDLHVKVSSDGATWSEALRVDHETGRVSLPTSGSAVPPTAGRLNVVGPAQGVALALSDNIYASCYLRPTTSGFVIGTDPGGILAFAPGGSAAGSVKWTMNAAGALAPAPDNAYPIGAASNRVSVLYAGSSTINTSDAREKTEVSPLMADEVGWAADLAREIGAFQFLGSVAAKGRQAARRHVGLTVQRAVELARARGLDPFRYAFICHDRWDETPPPATIVTPPDLPSIEAGDAPPAEIRREAGDRYAFRPDQLALFIARGHEARLAALERRDQAP